MTGPHLALNMVKIHTMAELHLVLCLAGSTATTCPYVGTLWLLPGRLLIALLPLHWGDVSSFSQPRLRAHSGGQSGCAYLSLSLLSFPIQ